MGDSSIRGGAINWGNFGSRLGSALSSTGRWLYNQGNRFVHSNTFKNFKQGVHDSGIIQNVGNLAGETLNALTDIGRLKLQQDLEKLRRKALGEDGPPSQAELQQLIAALQTQLGPPPTVAPPPPPPAQTLQPQMQPPNEGVPLPLFPTTRPIPEMVTPVLPPLTSTAPAVPADVPTTLEYNVPSKRPRKRARPGSWRNHLSNLSGRGVITSKRRMCY